MGRITANEVDTDESGTSIPRDFAFDYDDYAASGEITRTGPDGIDTYIELDDAGRVHYLRRGDSQDPLVEATYFYNHNGQVTNVTYGNTTWTAYVYNDAGRVWKIYHRKPSKMFMQKLIYTYNANGLPTQIDEWGASTLWTPSMLEFVTEFEYDDRNRLISEYRRQIPY